VLVHGLEGSSRSNTCWGNAARGRGRAGWNIIRMNMRNCGGTEDLSPTLYHSGLSGDVAAIMRTFAAEKGLGAFALVGYSMGGNLVLKLAGELGEHRPDYLKAVVGISPAMDLGVSADALHKFVEQGLRMEISHWGCAGGFDVRRSCSRTSIQPWAWKELRPSPVRRSDHRSLLRLYRRGRLLPIARASARVAVANLHATLILACARRCLVVRAGKAGSSER